MKRKLKVNLLYTGSIVLAVSAVGTAGNIEHAANGWGNAGVVLGIHRPDGGGSGGGRAGCSGGAGRGQEDPPQA